MWKYRGQKRPPFAEDPKPGQESVWDYPRPPKVVPCDRVVEVIANGAVIAHTTRAQRVLETGSPPVFYVPLADVDMSRLVEVPRRTCCEWKGVAKYWALASDPGRIPVAWRYDEPYPGFEALRQCISFYPGRVACFVAGARVRPQPGEFYGGWITDELVGPYKGEPGSENW